MLAYVSVFLELFEFSEIRNPVVIPSTRVSAAIVVIAFAAQASLSNARVAEAKLRVAKFLIGK